MNTAGLNLLIPDKPDDERDALAVVFCRGGGVAHRIGRFWDPPIFDPATVRVYGPDSFCLVLQQKLGFALCSPEDDLLLRLPDKSKKRWAQARYPKRFFDDSRKEGQADALKSYPEQRLVLRLFEEMSSRIEPLWLIRRGLMPR